MALTLTLSAKRLALRAQMDAERVELVRNQQIVKATRFAAAAGNPDAARFNTLATRRIIELSNK